MSGIGLTGQTSAPSLQTPVEDADRLIVVWARAPFAFDLDVVDELHLLGAPLKIFIIAEESEVVPMHHKPDKPFGVLKDTRS